MAHRAVFAPMPPVLYKDVNVSHISKFIQMIFVAARQIPNIGNIYVVWDKKIGKDTTNFRKQLVGSVYKSNRDHSKNNHIFDMIDHLVPVLAHMGLRNVFPYSLEGDDVMAWLARHHCKKCVIVTADEDMWQLINENVTIMNPKKGLITPANFEKFSPVPLDKYITWKCILGDGSDFVKGLDGYGKKKAPILAVNIHNETLDPEQIERLELNRKLLDLEYGLTQCPADIKAFESQIAFHNNKTKFNREKYCSTVGEMGLFDLADTRMITAIQQLSKARDLMQAFAGAGLLQSL
jgi:5'-3' exonuclease